MLSFIYKLVDLFDKEHGFKPNVVYLNQEHLKRLRDDLGGVETDALAEQLQMQVLLRVDSVHPNVGWMQAAARVA